MRARGHPGKKSTGEKPPIRVADHIIGGWQIGSKVFYHSGMPFSVTDGNTALGNFTGDLLAIPTAVPAKIGGCGAVAATIPCLSTAAFVDSNAADFTAYPGFSPQTRNQYRAAGFFDMDLNLFRNFKLTEKAVFGLGMTAFNFLNHPNFAAPDSSYGSSTFGQVTGMVGSPTSAYGNFLGFDSSIRVIQLSGKIVF